MRPSMLRRLYNWTLELAKHKYSGLALALIAFVESSIFPIPPDVLLIPMILAARNRAWFLAAICTLASVAGGMLGYAFGSIFFEQIGNPIIDIYGYGSKFEEFKLSYVERWGAWAVFFAGLTPFPYKVITILSGASQLDFSVFVFSSLLARGLRFFAIAILLWVFGQIVRDFIERYLGILFILFVILLLGGFLLVTQVI